MRDASEGQGPPPGSFPLRPQHRAWIREYARRGPKRIESSRTWRPEKCVAEFKARLRRAGLHRGRLLDLGCGRGRNSLPFLRSGWTVCGLDVAPAALKDFRRAGRGLPGRLELLRHDLAEPLPFLDSHFDAVQEITAADNLTRGTRRRRFWSEIARVLKPGGYFLTYHFLPQDGYYGPLLRKTRDPGRGRLYDPEAHMWFQFYSMEEIRGAAGNRLRLQSLKEYRYPGPMFGSTYRRVLQAAVWRRSGKNGGTRP